MKFNDILELAAVSAISLSVAAACLYSSAAAADKAGDWTIHTVSAHVGVSGLNNVNPGVGYNVTDGLRVGALYNSYKKPSLYAVGFFDVHPRFRVGAGVISGYTFEPDTFQVTGKTAGLIPAVVAEFDITDRVSVGWFGQAFNLEVKF